MTSTDQIPASWTMTRVDLVGSAHTGMQRSPDRQTGRYATRYVRAGNITPSGLDLSDLHEMDFTPEERETFSLMPGDILLTEGSGSAGQVGRAALWTGDVEDCCYQNTVIRFRPHAVVSEYALVVFRHYVAAGVFARTARGVGIQHLGASRFAALPFPLPPMAEQRRIAATASRKLQQLGEARDRLGSALENLVVQEREILAAATWGTLPPLSEEDASEKNSGVETHYPGWWDGPAPDASGQRLPLHPIPPGWFWTTVGEGGRAELGRQRAPAHHHGPHMRPYLRVANVLEDRIDTSDVRKMNFTPEEAAKYELRSGDILVNEGQSPDLVGRPAMYRGEIPGACFQNTLIRFRSGSEVTAEFALLVFRQYLHGGVFRAVARWSTNIAHLGLRRFQALPFPLPPLEEQRRLAEEARRRLDATESQASAVRASLAKLPDMERELLAAAVSGQLDAQDPGDESAEALLIRVGSPPARRRRRRTTGDGDQMARRRKPAKQTMDTAVDLGAVLRESGGALSLRELFARAGFDRDRVEHVEQFYLALRAQLGRSIRVGKGGTENVVVAEIDSAD